MDKYFMWIHYERLLNHNKAKHNKPVCIFLGIYCNGLFTDHSLSQCWLIIQGTLFTWEQSHKKYIETWVVSCFRRLHFQISWWRHQMETFSALLVLCAGNSLVTTGQWLVTYFLWSPPEKNGWVNNRDPGDLWHHRAHYDVTVVLPYFLVANDLDASTQRPLQYHTVSKRRELSPRETHSYCRPVLLTFHNMLYWRRMAFNPA